MIYLAERSAYFLLSFFYLLFPFILPMDNKTVNTFLTLALGIIILYHLVLTRLWPPLDLIYTKRMFRRFYTPAVLEKEELLPPPALQKGDRKGTMIVLAIYFIYIFTAAAITYFTDIVTWNLLTAWIFFLMGLNNIFIYKICLMRLLAMRNTNCCMDCRINGWDDMLIFSVLPLLFAAGEPLNQVNTGLIVLILAASVLHLILWEAGLVLFPERFFPWTNARLRCQSCKKRPCVGTVKGKFHD